MARRTSVGLALAMGLAAAAGAEPFVEVDADSGLFRRGDELFALLSVTYVQPDGEGIGANAGAIQVFDFDLTRIVDDFRHMRRLGVGAIYMRLGTGLFLTPEGEWRRIDDAYDGVLDPQGARAGVESRLAKAAAQGIGPFTYNYELFDYLLDCADMVGIYVVPMVMDNWSTPRKYDLDERLTAVTRAATWAALTEDWCKILSRYADRPTIIGYLFEGETFTLPPWDEVKWRYFAPDGPKLETAASQLAHNDPELRAAFQEFVAARHGDVDTLRARLRHGYDRAQVTYSGPNGATPRYPYVADALAAVQSFNEFPLPSVERGRGDQGPGPGANNPWWTNVPFDPVWVEFAYFKTWNYTDRLNTLIRALRQVCPNQVFFHSAAWDGAAVWHPFYMPWEHGALDCEVSLHGGGYPLSLTLSLPHGYDPFESCVELYQSVGCYRPFAGTPGTPRMFGMGEGGLAYESRDPDSPTVTEAEEAVWTTALALDNLGSGAGFVNIWDWSVLVGQTPENPSLHEHPVTASLKEVTEAIAGRTFAATPVRALILANGPMMHSLMKPLEYDNLRALSSALATAHYPFDIATTDEIVFGPTPGKVDLDRYDAVLMPELFTLPDAPMSGKRLLSQSPDSRLWALLSRWVEAAPNRVLILGAVGMRDAWFNPIEKLPGAFRTLTGVDSVGALERRDGRAVWRRPSGADLCAELKGVFTQSVSPSDGSAASWLTEDDRTVATQRGLSNGSRVYLCGFPLGLTWPWFIEESVAGGGLNTALDLPALAAFYASTLSATGILPAYAAPSDVQAHVSDDCEVVLMRRAITSDETGPIWVEDARLDGRLYADAATTVSGQHPVTRVAVADPGVDRAAVLRAVGRIAPTGSGSTTVAAATLPDEAQAYRLEVTGEAPVRLTNALGVEHTLEPGAEGGARVYTLRASGDAVALR